MVRLRPAHPQVHRTTRPRRQSAALLAPYPCSYADPPLYPLSPLVAGLLARRRGALEESKPAWKVNSGPKHAPELNPSETLEAAAVFHPVSPSWTPRDVEPS